MAMLRPNPFRLLTLILSTLPFLAQAEQPAKDKVKAKVQIQPLEAGLPTIVAQFNPKEISFDSRVAWQRAPDSKDDSPSLDFKSAEPKTLEFELEFDTYEARESVYKKYIAALEALAREVPELKRPPLVLVTWGGGIPTFQGVLSALTVKYTLFLEDGTPTRATVNVRLERADRAGSERHGHCSNGLMDGDETGVDCGGATCPACCKGQ